VATTVTVDERGDMFVRRARASDAERLAAIHVEAWKYAYRGQVPDPHLDALSVRPERWRTLVSDSSPSQATLVLVEDVNKPSDSCTAPRRATSSKMN
jgi:hypothetical protein